jgi:UTP--glucose-1-phosphate uridylyltransferase
MKPLNKVKTAIFPVGGLGTRFLPATKSMPKEMLPIVNKPIIQYAFEEARNAGIEKFIFITGRNKNTINNHFDHSYELESRLDGNKKQQEVEKVSGWIPAAGQIAFVRQQKPLGLGHAIWCARNFIAENEAFVVILADEMMLENNENRGDFLKSMLDFYYQQQESSNIVAVDEVMPTEVEKYGIIAIDSKIDNKICAMVEKPKQHDAPSNLAITGRYILQPTIFNELAKAEIGSGGEIQLTDAMNKMLDQQNFYYKKIEKKRFDCGSVLGYIEANLAFAFEQKELATDLAKILKNYNK